MKMLYALVVAAVFFLETGSAYAVGARASSGESDSSRAEYAVDGNFATRWSSAFSDNEWLDLDLGATQVLVGVTLYWESAFGKQYDVRISKDGQNWITVYRVRDGDGAVDDIYFGPQECRFLRIAGIQRGTTWGYSLWEVVMKNSEYEIKLTASSTAEGDVRSLLDGDLKTAWRSKPDDAHPWVQLELAKGLLAARVDLVWSETPPQQFALETSEDGETWKKIFEGKGSAGPMTCPVSLGGVRRLRLSCTPQGDRGCALAELKLKSWDEAFSGGGLDLVHGIVGAEEYAWVTFVGKDGTFGPEPQPFQASFWLTADGVIHAPEMFATRWALRGGSLPISEVSWEAGPIQVKQTTFARYVDELKRLVTFSRITLENRGSDSGSVDLHMLLRANPMAFKWNVQLSELAYDGEGAVKVNGKPALFVRTPPADGAESESAVGRAARLAALRAGETVQVNAAVRGGLLTFPCVLAPGAVQSFDVFALAGEETPVAAGDVRSLDFDQQLARTEQYWEQRVPLRVEVPDYRYTDAFYASLHYLLIMMKDSKLFPGPYNYKCWFLHDAVEMNSAMDNTGLHDVAKRVTDHFNYQEGGGYLDELGGSVYGLYEHARMARDQEFLKNVYPRMIKACRLIQKLRSAQKVHEFKDTPIYGLLPKSVSQDNFTIPAYLYVDNWWSVIGLRSAADAARRLGEAEDEKWLTAEYESLLNDTVNSIRAVMKKENLDFMPGFADYWPPDQRPMDAEHRILGDTQMAWAHRSPLFPGRTLGIPLPLDLFAQSYRKYWERSGKFSNYDGGWYVEYEKLFWGYNVQLAMPPMYLGMEDITLKNIEWSLRHQSCPGGWAEGYITEEVDGLRLVGPGPIVGDVPHGWTAAYYILLVRNMLMREEQGALLLTPCVPSSWIAPGKRIAMSQAPTYYGLATWSVECKKAGELNVSVEMAEPPPKGVVVCLPKSLQVTEASRPDGEVLKCAGNKVLLPAGVTNAVIRFQ